MFGTRPRPVTAEEYATLPHVVIVGGGFAGVNAARRLKHSKVRITLVDRNVFKTFQPLLYQVATGGLNPGDVTLFLRGMAREIPNLRVRQGEVTGIDPRTKTMEIEQGETEPFTLDYDYLVIANGLTTNFFDTSGAEEHAMPMYTRQHATAIRDRIFAELERTNRSEDHDCLVVSVVGGGATGVEIAGALADFRRDDLTVMYPELSEEVLHIRVIQRGTDLLKNLDEPARRYAADELRQRGVELALGEGVNQVGYDWVTLTDGTQLESDITIWAAGVGPAEATKEWNLPLNDHGLIAVDQSLQVEGLPGVYAAGDIAGQVNPIPQQAQPAIQTGVHAANMILADLEGQPHAPFHYRNLGEAATIGRRDAVVSLPNGTNITGTAGWLAWMTIHVAKLIGHRNRRAVAVNLFSLYAARRSGHKPNPVTGDVDSLTAARVFAEMAGTRRFGAGHRG
ncbi:NAD(P)/FAD-dependent oxidoreductase [Kocuria sp.]|uniref:NAD(P)/FAD-dependent oxidoreductase n=1 Tax=Kocuria sp. TaxID=1871328 RepID=UPI0026DFF42D|nr:NAD(P)/FAD-dependent oxidoreductase [Kocuria sp.]MDO5619813.1 NAD(P)/FAD-dependent oxidoreductase [Kocuria sp.]